ncbi:MAG: DUF6434 domain-containing protein [Micropruina sp.]|uniref:DUF6434 domain-containing protein n=1 Tax=Micropruina sp. TaxID=2737536 RepID=UPI0039E3709E
MSRTRPELQPGLPAAEFIRWYWLKAELQQFARVLGIRAGGGKQQLTDRIEARLAGRPFAEPRSSTPNAAQLSGPLTADTAIPAGQRCSQHLRTWFVARLGTGFRFDAPMREFFDEADGTQTLGDAVAHWHATRDQGPRDVAGQFEYNRFTRAWHAQHPDASRREVIDAWNDYRSRPIDERGRV